MGSAQLAAGSFFPLDEELELLPGSLTPGLEEMLVRLGSWMPFAQAQGVLVDWMQLNSLSEATVRRHTEAAGAAYVVIQEEEAKALEQGLEPDREVAGSGSARLVVEVDGAMAPLVGGEWAEVKTMVIGKVDETGAEPGTLKELSYFSRLTEAANFTRQALAETHRRGVGEGCQVALVSDGAEWIQGFGDFHCPGAVRILDFPHAAGYIGEIGRGLFGEASQVAEEWQREQRHRLKYEGAGPVLEEMRVLVQGCETDLSKPLAYLEKREAQMCYPVWQAQGWPIGSGAVESGNKLVVEERLKGGGMHWARPHVNPMLGLRNIVCSDRWPGEWPRIARRLRKPASRSAGTPGEQTGSKRRPAEAVETGTKLSLADRPEVTVKSPAEVAVSGGGEESTPPYRPAANHPWRRAPVGRARLFPKI